MIFISDKFLYWRLYNTENGVLSHGSTFLLSWSGYLLMNIMNTIYRAQTSQVAQPFVFFTSIIVGTILLITVLIAKYLFKKERNLYYFVLAIAILGMFFECTLMYEYNNGSCHFDILGTLSSIIGIGVVIIVVVTDPGVTSALTPTSLSKYTIFYVLMSANQN